MLNSRFCSVQCEMDYRAEYLLGARREKVRLASGAMVSWLHWCKFWGQCPYCMAPLQPMVGHQVAYERSHVNQAYL